jgi:hypothetical protein
MNPSGRPDRIEEPRDLAPQAIAVSGQCLRGGKHLRGSRTGLAGARCTSVMLEDTCWVPCAARSTLREISCVACPCCSTAAAMADETSESFSIVPLMSLIAPTDCWVAA